MKTTVSLAVSLALGGALAGQAAAQDHTILAGHGAQRGHPTHLALEHLAELVDERSDGRLEVQVFPDRQLGEEREMVEGLQFGTVDMTVVSTGPLGGFVPQINVLDLPFLFEDRVHAYAVFDGAIGRQLMDEFEAIDIHAAAIWENGWRHLTSNIEVGAPDDLEGVKIRTMENPIHIAAFQALGAGPVPMVWGEVYTSLDQGVIDAQENPITVIYTNSLWEVQNHTTLTGHVYGPHLVLISRSTLDGLPEDLRQILLDAVGDATDYQREQSVVLEQEQIELLRAEGMTVTPIDTTPFRERMQAVHDEYQDQFGADLIANIRQAADGS